MAKLFLILVLAFVADSAFGESELCGISPIGSRIANGREAVEHKYPWMVALYDTYHDEFFCGATIVNER